MIGLCLREYIFTCARSSHDRERGCRRPVSVPGGAEARFALCVFVFEFLDSILQCAFCCAYPCTLIAIVPFCEFLFCFFHL